LKVYTELVRNSVNWSVAKAPCAQASFRCANLLGPGHSSWLQLAFFCADMKDKDVGSMRTVYERIEEAFNRIVAQDGWITGAFNGESRRVQVFWTPSQDLKQDSLSAGVAGGAATASEDGGLGVYAHKSALLSDPSQWSDGPPPSRAAELSGKLYWWDDADVDAKVADIVAFQASRYDQGDDDEAVQKATLARCHALRHYFNTGHTYKFGRAGAKDSMHCVNNQVKVCLGLYDGLASSFKPAAGRDQSRWKTRGFLGRLFFHTRRKCSTRSLQRTHVSFPRLFGRVWGVF
jgi:hypothetical protein